ncbi:MAG: hypothetical protein ACREEM_55155 [Blastocatellia bacterium]
MTQVSAKQKGEVTAARPALDPQRNYSIPEGASVAGVAAITIWRAVYAGHCQTYRVGRRRIVSGAQLQAWLEAGGKTGRTIGGAPNEK